MKRLLTLLLPLLLAHQASAARTNLVENTFSDGAEGWLAVDLPDGSRLVDSAPATTLVWTNASGALGASIAITDASSGTIFFSAPDTVVTNLGRVYGSFLEFDLTTSTRTWIESDYVVVRGSFEGKPRAAIGVLPRLPGDDWTSYSIRLVASNFRWDQKNGPAISPRDFRNFIRTAAVLWLPAEFGTGPVETTRLRNVRVVAEELLAAHCVPALTLDGFAGQQFRIEYLEVLGKGSWQPLTTVTLADGPYIFIDTDSIDGLPRFYRAIELP